MEEGERKAREVNVMYIETSAKAGYNVKQVCPGNLEFNCTKQLQESGNSLDLTVWIYKLFFVK